MVALRGTLGVTSTDQGHIFDRLSYRTPAAHRCHSKGFSGALTAIFFHIYIFLDSRYGLRLKGGTAGSRIPRNRDPRINAKNLNMSASVGYRNQPNRVF